MRKSGRAGKTSSGERGRRCRRTRPSSSSSSSAGKRRGGEKTASARSWAGAHHSDKQGRGVASCGRAGERGRWVAPAMLLGRAEEIRRPSCCWFSKGGPGPSSLVASRGGGMAGFLGPLLRRRSSTSWRGCRGVQLPQPERKKNKKSGMTERDQHGRAPSNSMRRKKCCRDHQIDLKMKNKPPLYYFYYLPIR